MTLLLRESICAQKPLYLSTLARLRKSALYCGSFSSLLCAGCCGGAIVYILSLILMLVCVYGIAWEVAREVALEMEGREVASR